jgi:O-antigen ligase
MSLGAVVILVPSFRAKMFYQPDKAGREVVLTTDVLSNQQFNNDGRFSMWTEVLNRFYWPNPVMGSGLGATQAWFYGGGAEQVLHSKIKVEHSEYVKLAADTGTVGLGLYMAMHLCAFAMAIGAYRRSRGGMARIFSVAAACALPVFWVCMAFDNSLLYVLPVAQFPTALAAIAWRLSTISTSDRVENLPSTRPGAPLLARRRVGQRFADVAGNRAKNLSPAAHV